MEQCPIYKGKIYATFSIETGCIFAYKSGRNLVIANTKESISSVRVEYADLEAFVMFIECFSRER